MLLNKRRLCRDLGERLLPRLHRVCIGGGHRGRQRDLEQSQFSWCKVTCSLTKPKPGAQRTEGQKPSGGSDLLAAADSVQPHLLSHLTKQSLYIQGCRNRDREASWLGPNATPYQAVGPSAPKGHMKMESVHPTLKSRGLSKRLGLTRAAHMGLLNNYLDFPLETHSPSSLLAADIISSRTPFFFFF